MNENYGKIYKIEPINKLDDGDIYIGSTSKKYLNQRMTGHISRYKLWKKSNKNFISSFTLFDKYGVNNCSIILLECVNGTKYELHTREAYYIRTLKCVNKNIPNRTNKEYFENNKENILNMISELGFNNIFDKKNKINAYDLSSNFMDIYDNNNIYRSLKITFNYTDETSNKKLLGHLNTILKNYSLKIVSTVKRVGGNRKINVYNIEELNKIDENKIII